MFDPSDSYPMVELDSDREEQSSSEDEIDVILHGTPEQRRRLRRRSLGRHSSSSEDEFEKEMDAELNATMASMQKQQGSTQSAHGSSQSPQPSSSACADGTSDAKYYDNDYFDSDEDDMDDDTKLKQRAIPSNDDLLYDPNMDEEDQKWIDSQRQRYLPKPPTKKSSILKKGPNRPKPLPYSDAVLNCPACMSLLCLDCQKHATYANQYRAMFVTNCVIDRTECLHFPKVADKKKGKKLKRNKNPTSLETVDPSVESSEEKFHPVRCQVCTTQVGVYDQEEIYHFFNVLSSYS